METNSGVERGDKSRTSSQDTVSQEKSKTIVIDKLTKLLFNFDGKDGGREAIVRLLASCINTTCYKWREFQPIVHLFTEKIEPYHPREVVSFLSGICLVFFGGYFPTILSTVEGFRVTGIGKVGDQLKDLWSEVIETVDCEPGVNVGSSLQSTDAEPATVFWSLVKRALATSDPERVKEVVNQMIAGVATVVTSLRIQSAETVTLGSTLGSALAQVVVPNLRHGLESRLGAPYNRWVSPVLESGSQVVGVALAWRIGRLLSAVLSAIHGSQICTTIAMKHLRKQMTSNALKDPQVASVVSMAIAMTGLHWQLKHGLSRLPFPLNIILSPASLLEFVLTYLFRPAATAIRTVSMNNHL